MHTNKGRIDAVIETPRCVYIMEFKMGTTQEALSQIEDRQYYEKYLSSGKEIRLIGIGFNEEERNISGYEVRSIDREKGDR